MGRHRHDRISRVIILLAFLQSASAAAQYRVALPQASEAPDGWQIGFSPALAIGCCGWKVPHDPNPISEDTQGFYTAVALDFTITSPVPTVDTRLPHRMVWRLTCLSHPGTEPKQQPSFLGAAVGWKSLGWAGDYARLTAGAELMGGATWEYPNKERSMFIDYGILGRARFSLSYPRARELLQRRDPVRIGWTLGYAIGIDAAAGVMLQGGPSVQAEVWFRLLMPWTRWFVRRIWIHHTGGFLFGFDVDRWP